MSLTMMIGCPGGLLKTLAKIVPSRTSRCPHQLMTAAMRGASGQISDATVSLKMDLHLPNTMRKTFLDGEEITKAIVRGLMEIGPLVMKIVGLGIGLIALMMEEEDPGNGVLKVTEAIGIVPRQVLETVLRTIPQPSLPKFSRTVPWKLIGESALVTD